MFNIHRLALLSMLLLLISGATCLPAMMREDIKKSIITATTVLDSLATDTIINEAEEMARTPLLVQVDRFAQLVATHWLFDHLESIKTRSYDHIATRLGRHVQLLAVGSNEDNDENNDNTLVDLDILKAQIFGAIQAHIGGHLPVAWEDLSADTLSKPALERHIAALVNTHCPSTTTTDILDMASINSVNHGCLLLQGDQILDELDQYVMGHLQDVFRVMDTQVIPDLLKHTEKDLHQVIDYFNGVQQQQASSMQLALQVSPWNADHPAVAADATTPTIASADQGSSIASADPPPSSLLSSSAPDDHDSHRIDQYADLAIVL